MALKPTIKTPKGIRAPLDIADMRRNAHIVVDKAGRDALGDHRSRMKATGMGKLERAIGYTSSLKKGRTSDDFAWASIHIRGDNERTVGAIESYTRSGGTTIRPVHGKWLWYPTGRVPRTMINKVIDPKTGKLKSSRSRYGRAAWKGSALETKVGELEFIPFRPNLVFLVIRNVTLDRNKRNARRATGGRLRTRYRKPFIIAFIGIRVTRRAQRYDSRAPARRQQEQMPSLLRQSLVKPT